MVTEPTPYEQGVAAGKIMQRLDGYDRHFLEINGSVRDTATALNGVKLQLQRLTDAIDANQRTVATTAEAVEKERKTTAQALRDSTEKRWSPLTRLSVIVGIIAAIGGIIALIIANLPGK